MCPHPNRTKNRRNGKPFLRLPRDILDSDEYAQLSPIALKLMLDLGAQFRGHNNGDLTTAWSTISGRGWKSKDTLYRAMHELEETGFIIRTRQGGKNKCNLFALSWEPIDECNWKLDVNPTKVAPNTWRKLNSHIQLSGQPRTNIVPKRQK